METSVEILAPASAAWKLLTDTSRWPEWGPLVSRVESAEQYIDPGSIGRVQTIIGVWLPFRVTEFVAGKRWGWEVAGIRPPFTGWSRWDLTAAEWYSRYPCWQSLTWRSAGWQHRESGAFWNRSSSSMNNTAESNDILQKLCTGQPLAVLATDAGNGPYASLVAVAVTPDLRQLFFTTLRATRKWANLAGNHHVSLLIDNRSNQVTDFSRAAAATILGIAEELSGTELATGLAVFLGSHPHLAEFTASPSCALFRVQISSIYLVTRFQNVIEFHFSP